MVQKTLGQWSIRKKMPLSELNKRVGSIYVKDQVGRSSVKRSMVLQKWLTDNLKNKTEGQAKKYLIKYGIQGSQGLKREKVLELIFGDGSKKTGGGKAVKASDGRSFLTEKQIARNLMANMQRDEITREETKTSFAGGTVSTRSIGISESQKNKNPIGAERLGIKNQVGFAGGQSGKATPGINFKS
ncbi:MAG: hypothetical protein V1801_00335 [Candidatus Falkowbacteria bacterium]